MDNRQAYRPSILYIESETSCDAPCHDFCFRKLGGKNLSPEEIELILNYATKVGVTKVVLTGGEPTLKYERYANILEMIQKRGFEVEVLTNARFANDLETAKKFLKGRTWKVDYVQFSVNRWLFQWKEKDGKNQKAHEQARRLANAIAAAVLLNLKKIRIRAISDPTDDLCVTTMLQLVREELENLKEVKLNLQCFPGGDLYKVNDTPIEIVRRQRIHRSQLDFLAQSNNIKAPHSLFFHCINAGYTVEPIFGTARPLNDPTNQQIVYGPDGIHPCCIVYYQHLKLLARKDVLDNLKKRENVLKKAIAIGNNEEWMRRYEAGCAVCIKQCMHSG